MGDSWFDALWGWPPPVLDPAGPYASSVTTLAWALMAMGVVVTGVVLVALYIAIKGPPRLKAAIGGEKAVWIGGVIFPGVVLTGLLIWGLTLTASLTREISGHEMRVRVVGEMWWFRVQYLDPAGRVLFEDANELHLPVGEPVVLELRSNDVIHNFWVPHLSGKKDMIPGRINLLQVQADKPGRYGGVCAEYCGGPHALMGFVAVAQPKQDFAAWLARRQNPAPLRVAQAEAAAGRRLFMETGCAACHRVAGTEANGRAGPDLTHMGTRLTVGAGILPNNRGTLTGWIGDSQSIKPGNRMPSYSTLSAQDLNAIAAWLEQPR